MKDVSMIGTKATTKENALYCLPRMGPMKSNTENENLPCHPCAIYLRHTTGPHPLPNLSPDRRQHSMGDDRATKLGHTWTKLILLTILIISLQQVSTKNLRWARCKCWLIHVSGHLLCNHPG